MTSRLKLFFAITIAFSFTCYGQDTILVPTQKMPKEFNCYHNDTSGLIKSQEQLKSRVSLRRVTLTSMGCGCYLFPEIDFKKNDLIWVNFDGNGKGLPNVETYLYKIPAQKKYVYLIKVTCYHTDPKRPPSDLMLMAEHELTEKLEKDYTFEYKVEAKKEKYIEK